MLNKVGNSLRSRKAISEVFASVNRRSFFWRPNKPYSHYQVFEDITRQNNTTEMFFENSGPHRRTYYENQSQASSNGSKIIPEIIDAEFRILTENNSNYDEKIGNKHNFTRQTHESSKENSGKKTKTTEQTTENLQEKAKAQEKSTKKSSLFKKIKFSIIAGIGLAIYNFFAGLKDLLSKITNLASRALSSFARNQAEKHVNKQQPGKTAKSGVYTAPAKNTKHSEHETNNKKRLRLKRKR